MRIGWLDEYERRARLMPGLFALLPIPILILSLGLRRQPVIVGIAGLVGAIGLPVLLTSTVRAHGLKLQERLYAKWGGAPTTECLRHRGPKEEAARREQWRRDVIKLVGHSLPTIGEEQDDPVLADGRYRAAVAEVIARTTEKVPLVFEENKNYGFERNLLAMRPFALRLAGVGLVAEVLALMATTWWGAGLSASSLVIGLIAVLIVLATWIYVPSEDRTHRIGHRYAERLFDSLTRL